MTIRPSPLSHRFFAILLSILAVPLAAAQQANPWPHFLGQGSDLSELAPQLTASRGVPTVKVRWRRLIGPGYTQPVVSNKITYVGFSDGHDDVLVALSRSDGSEVWRYKIAPTWRGVDGSDDGPISTPSLVEGGIVGVGPRGHLFALDARTGHERWRVDLVAEHGLNAGTYGVATSPLIHKGLVIVLLGGGEGRSIAAFDLQSGTRRWSIGNDSVEYQSPRMAEFCGVHQVLAVTATRVSGIDPATGKILWSQTYTKKALNHSCPVVLMGDGRFVINTSVDCVAFVVEGDAETMSARRLWRTRELKRSYTVPVYRDGFIYGWSGSFLVCVDAATGKRRWKSRQPGLGSLLGLSDWLVAWTVEGRLAFLRPTPEAYEEVASFAVMTAGSLVHPAWTGDGLLVRGVAELAFLDVEVTAKSEAVADVTELSVSPNTHGAIADLLSRLANPHGEGAEKEQKLILDQFFATVKTTPLVEDDGTVHFVYRGPAEDVGLILGFAPNETALPMVNPKGTDLWVRTEKLNPRGAYSYRFEIDGEQSVVDPKNARRASFFAPTSLLQMPSFQPDAAFSQGAQPTSRNTGNLETVKFRSKLLDNERSVGLYTPPGFDSDRTYPLVLVTSGMDRFFGRMPAILDRVMGRTVQRAIVVFVDIAEPVDTNIFYETLGHRGPLFTRMLVEELLPYLGRRYHLTNKRAERLVMGTSLPGGRALDLALRYPQLFGAVAAQSATLNAAAERELERVVKASPTERPRIYLDWCERDSVSINEAMHVKRTCRKLKRILDDAGYEVTARELPGGYSWEMWSTQTQAILEQFLPMRD